MSPVFLNLLISGSSPLTRGILLHAVEISRSCRFTPAHAGNTESVPAMFLQAQVHPRSRGEYLIARWNRVTVSGSPPLTRGILFTRQKTYIEHRFTPAHAGNTFGQISSALALKVHPRSRGEYDTKAVLTAFYEGSPPLTRGIQECKRADYQRNRFTPAHAGNTMAFDKKKYIQKVHPRSRGEYI